MIKKPVLNMDECKILEYIHREKADALDFIMIIFSRYEKEDGGGPFFTRDGISRQTGDICNDDTLNGCLSVEKLDDWFNKRNIDISDYKMVEYVGEPIYHFEDGSYLFRKSSSAKI